jgi:hypothetical protein
MELTDKLEADEVIDFNASKNVETDMQFLRRSEASSYGSTCIVLFEVAAGTKIKWLTML